MHTTILFNVCMRAFPYVTTNQLAYHEYNTTEVTEQVSANNHSHNLFFHVCVLLRYA
jgi:hypothetical protein